LQQLRFLYLHNNQLTSFIIRLPNCTIKI